MVDFVLRPVKEHDFHDLLRCTDEISYGFTTFPRDPRLLKEKIHRSITSFVSPIEFPGKEDYLFVLEELSSHQVVGTSGIIATTGSTRPFYAFKIHHVQHACPSLAIFKEHRLLHLIEEKKGPTEIGALFLKTDFRGRGLAKLLSLSRFHFMDAFQERFHSSIVAELRGLIDEKGYAPFYEGVCKPFLDISYAKANSLRIVDETFIYDLMPKEPIYINLLPSFAKEAIGAIHPLTKHAHQLLIKQGFFFYGDIDIFDGGPDLIGTLAELKTIKEKRKAKICASDAKLSGNLALICNNKIDFRACLSPFLEKETGLEIPKKTLEALELEGGEEIVYTPLS